MMMSGTFKSAMYSLLGALACWIASVDGGAAEVRATNTFAASAPFRIINITPLLVKHKAEITADLRRLQQDCGVTDVAFMLPLHPQEAKPSMDKPMRLRDLFLEMREPLRGSGLRVGILLQSLIGHGTPTDAKFQRITTAAGTAKNSFCPLDPDFKNYIRQAVATVTATRPDFLLVDDDFRLSHGDFGCFCPLHLAAFNKVVEGHFTRESLMQTLRREDAESRRLGSAWESVRLASLASLAQAIREEINSVDPDLPCGFCACGEMNVTVPLAKILAGRKPPFIRINNAWYLENDGRGLLGRVYWMAAQMEAFKEVPELLSESDTYPQNRYCTPARALNGQITLSLLYGTTGAKLWVTRLREYEPDSGLAYREVLQRNTKRYAELRRLYPSVRWDEPATPLPSQPVSIWNPADLGRQRFVKNWAADVVGHMGIPCRVTSGAGADVKTLMLTGPEVAFFTDAELKSFLSRGLLLDGPAAEQLCQRGFAELLGVEVQTPSGWRADFERMNEQTVNGSAAGKLINISALLPGSAVRLSARTPRVQALSSLYRVPSYLSSEESLVGPGLTLFENPLGGRVAVFAAAMSFTPFMNEIRREQLISVLGWLNRAPLPVVVVSDVDIYARHGVLASEEGGGELLCIFNLNMDSLPELRLRVSNPGIKEISRLEGDGIWRTLAWHPGTGSELVVQTPLEPMQPLILRLRH
jgi:hypothetical protein